MLAGIGAGCFLGTCISEVSKAVVVGTGPALESLLDRRWAPRRQWALGRLVSAPVRWLRRSLTFLRVLAASRR